MKNVHEPIKRILRHYAEKLHYGVIDSVLGKESIDSEDEAKAIIAFLDYVSKEVAKDSKENVVVLNQPVHTTDAEKVCDVVEDYIEEIGYGYLLE